jgi:polyisoprenoid-binding protein YceI
VRTFVLVALLAGTVPAFAESRWEIDPAHSSVQFSVRHMMVSNVRGEFTKVSASVRADEQEPTRSTIEATVDASSIDTREPKRDEHLRGPDFLDVAKYPTITFRSTKITKTGEGRYDVTGDLTLHGVTRPVVLAVEGPSAEVKDPRGAVRAGATATTRIDRRDFGIAWSKALDGGGLVVGNEIAITIDVEAVKK